MSPGVSIMVRLGQYLYSILTTISLDQNCCSRSSRWFSFSMYSCRALDPAQLISLSEMSALIPCVSCRLLRSESWKMFVEALN